MREILFRGKRRDNGEWVEGGIAWNYFVEGDVCILTDRGEIVSVDTTTVGQYTGLKDCNGERIFEGDIVEILSENEEIGVVEYEDGGFLVSADGFCVDFHSNINGTDLEVIDNIHDNLEALDTNWKF